MRNPGFEFTSAGIARAGKLFRETPINGTLVMGFSAPYSLAGFTADLIRIQN